MTPTKVVDPIKTLEITDFTGKLTRKINGMLNSGFAKFDTSWGYDPFSKPGNLTWFEAPVDLDPTDASIAMTIVAAKPVVESANQLFIYAIGTNYLSGAKLFKIQPNSLGNPNLDTSSVLATLTNNSFLYGGSLEQFGSNSSVLSFTNDTSLVTINMTGSAEQVRGTLVANAYHPLVKFLGKLFVGNGAQSGNSTNISSMDSTNIVTASVLTIPVNGVMRDMNVTPDGNYISIAASEIPNERQDYAYDRISAATGSGFVYNWNGTDTAITNYKSFPSHAITAFKTYMSNQYLFSNDSFGMSLDIGGKKIRTFQNNRSSIPNSIASNGNFVTWMATEFVDSTLKASMYYYGSLDEETPQGLWRMFRQASSQTNGFIYTVPFNILAGNKFSTLNSAETAVATYGYGKHYFSTYDISNGGLTIKNKLYRFLVTSSGTGTPNLGVWESQTQLFGKRVSVSAIRAYCEGTVAGNGFQLDIIGSDGSVVTGGSFTYTYSAGTDMTLLQGSLERINFNPSLKNLYAIGVRITNTGTTNMTFKKVEVDYGPGGK